MVYTEQFKTREEWLAGRHRIGGSEAASIVGLNPYMTNVELWEIKTGRRQRTNLDDNPFVEYGRKAEEYLRELFKLDFPQFNLHYIENNLWTNDRFPFGHASLDGWLTDENGRLGILEIKTTNILQSMQKEKWNHRIPDNYYIQLLHYLAITEADFAILKAQLKYDYDGEIFLNTKHYTIERADVEADIDYLMQEESRFYKAIKSDEMPALVLPEI